MSIPPHSIRLAGTWLDHRVKNTSLKLRNRPLSRPPQGYREAMDHRLGGLIRALTPRPGTLTLLERERLDPADPDHGTWRLSLEGDWNPSFVPGDMIYLRWKSPPAEVERVIELLDADGETKLRLLTAGSKYLPSSVVSCTLREALTTHVETQEASTALLRRAGLEHMARHNEKLEEEHQRFHAEVEKSGVAWHEHPEFNPYRVHVPSLLAEMGAHAPRPEQFVYLQERSYPRPYTISAFDRLGKDGFRAEITVSQVSKNVRKPDGGELSVPARGSSYLSSLEPGTTLDGWVLPEMHHFPSSLGRSVPTIVICTGSGISGIRALLRAGYDGGALWLIYGVRSWEKKHLYGPELERLHAKGTITRLDVAESRPAEGTGRHVQDILWDAREDVAEWLKRGAHLYMSGRLSMGREAGYVIRDIAIDQGLVDSETDADALIEKWAKELRLQASVSGV